MNGVFLVKSSITNQMFPLLVSTITLRRKGPLIFSDLDSSAIAAHNFVLITQIYIRGDQKNMNFRLVSGLKCSQMVLLFN